MEMDKQKVEFERFLKDWNLAIPDVKMALIKNDEEFSLFAENDNPLERLKSGYESEKILSFFSLADQLDGDQNDGFSVAMREGGGVFEKYQPAFSAQIYELLNYKQENRDFIRLTNRNDANVLATMHCLNMLCEQFDSSIEFRLITRSQKILKVMNAMPQGMFKGVVVHPFFLVENFDLTNPEEREHLFANISDDCLELIRLLDLLLWDLDLLRSSPENEGPVNKAIANKDGELESQVEKLAGRLASILCGISLDSYYRNMPEIEQMRLKDIYKNRFERVHNSNDKDKFESGIDSFFSVLKKIMDSEDLQHEVQENIEDIEKAFIERCAARFEPVNNFGHFVELPDAGVMFRLGWGFMRPAFHFTHGKVLAFLKLQRLKEQNTEKLPSWDKVSARIEEILNFIDDHFDNVGDEHLKIELILLKGIIVSAMSRFQFAARIVSVYIKRNEAYILDEKNSGKFDINLLRAFRELYILRHFCARASAFAQECYLTAPKPVEKDFRRARRDLDHAFQISWQIKEKNKLRMQRANSADVEEQRMYLSYVAGYLEVLIKCWEPHLDERFDKNDKKDQARHKGNDALRMINAQKNYWNLSDGIRRCLTVYYENRHSNNRYQKYLCVRALQLNLTAMLVILIDIESPITAKLLSLKAQDEPTPNDLLILKNYKQWYEEMRRITFEYGIAMQSYIRIIAPVMEILKSVDIERKNGCQNTNNNENYQHRSAQLEKLVKVVDKVKVDEYGYPFRKEGFYYYLTWNLVKLFDSKPELFKPPCLPTC